MLQNLRGACPPGAGWARPRKRKAGRIAWAIALAAAVLGPATVRAQAATGEPLQACFVYVSPVGQAGWTFQHEQGRLALQAALPSRVKTRMVEAVPEGPDSGRVMRGLALDGCGLIFATSFGYLEPALKVAAEFPQVRFEHAGGHKTAPNLNTYNARYYEARWLAGWLAGKASRSGTAGYVAGFPVPEVVQGLNAFALGMRAANPKAEVRVVWLNAWFDPGRERDAALALVAQGADVLTNHSGSPAVAQVAEEKGIRLLSYQSDMRRFAPSAQLAAVTHHWGPYYTRVARAVLDGQWQPRPVWEGMREGLVQLSAVDPRLPAELRQDLERLRLSIVDGHFKPFSGRLVDQAGQVRQGGGFMPDAQIAAMDWLVQGVVGTLPGGR